MYLILHSSIIHNSQDREATYMSINRWMDKEDVVHIYNGVLLSHKKEWNNAIYSNMDRPGMIRLSKVSQKKNISYHLYVKSKLWHKMNLYTKQKQTADSQTQRTELWLSRGSVLGGGMGWEFGISICKLLYMEWINNKSYCIAQGTIFTILQ